MKGKTLGRRIVAWILTLAMVLTTVNLPALSVEAEGGHTHAWQISVTDNTATVKCTAEGCSYTTNTEYTVTISADGGTYNGTAYEAMLNKTEAFPSEVSCTIKYYNRVNDVKNGDALEGGAPKNVGNYIAEAEIGNDSNIISVSFDITPKKITVSGITASNKTYDGNTDATLIYTGAIYTGIVEGDTLTVSATGTFDNANVGDGKTVTISNITLDGEDVDNYELDTSGQQTETTANITAKALTDSMITLESSSFEYDTNEKSINPTVKDGEKTLTENTDYEIATGSVSKGTNAGTYTFKITGKGNYSGNASKAWTITQATDNEFTTVPSIAGWTYGNDAESPSATAKFGEVTYTYSDLKDGTYTSTVPTKAGDHYMKATVAGTDNYTELVSDPVKFTIAKKQITVSGITAKGKTYDGNTDATLIYTGAIYTGIVEGDTLTVSATGTFDNANVGDGKTVTISNITLDGEDVDNYELDTSGQQTETTANITAKALTDSMITLESSSFEYDTNEKSINPTVKDGEKTLTENTDYEIATGSVSKGTNAGTYTFKITGKGNYSGDASKAWTITQATDNEFTTAPSIAGWTYGSAANTPSATAKYGTATYTYSDSEDGTYTSAVPTKAGDHYMKATVAGTENYTELVSDPVKFTIAKKQITVSGITAEDKTYDGNTDATLIYTGAKYTGIVEGDTLTVSATGKFVDANAGEGKKVTIKDITLGGTSADNYKLAKEGQQSDTTANITAKSLSNNMIKLNPQYYTYDGETKKVVFTVVDGTMDISEENYTISSDSDEEGTDVGKYTIAITGKNNYKDDAIAFWYISINNDNEFTTAPTIEGWTYGETASQPNSVVKYGTPKYTYSDSKEGTYTENVPTKAGKYYMKAVVGGTDNYNGLESDPVEFTISKKEITISGITAENKEYDGKTDATLSYADVEYTGIVANDELSVSAKGVFTDVKANASIKVNISDIVLSGASVDNYELAKDGQQSETTAAITPRAVKVSGITAEDKTYDGTIGVTIVTDNSAFDRLVGEDKLEISATGEFVDANAGNDKKVTLSGLTLSGDDKDNYILAGEGQQEETSAGITPKAISVEWKNIEFVYDGNKHAPTANAKDLIEGDTCNVVVEGEKIDANADGQTYTATATLSNTNYELKDSATQTFTIKRADGTVSGTCADIVYENKFKPAISNTTNTGAAVVWYYREEGAAYKEWKESDSIPSVGNYEIYAKVAATNNYNECESSVIKVKVTQADPKYTVPKVSAFCGDKLSEVKFTQPDNGEFVWVNQDTVVKEGNNVVDVKFVPKDTKNYKSVDKISLEVEAVHDFAGFTHLTHVEAVAAVVADKKAGLREYYECATCGKKIGTDKEVHNDSYFIIPCVPKSIDITLGTTKKIDSYVLDGSDGVKTTSIDSTTKYKKYLTFDESTGTIKTPSSGQYYKKKKLGTPTITVTDQAGETYKVKLNLSIRKPATFNVGKKYIGNDIYEYTLECKAAYADNITIEAIGGLASKSIMKKLNNILKQRVKDNIKPSKKKTTVKVSFTANKKSFKGKIKFRAIAKYGKNKSLASVKSK